MKRSYRNKPLENEALEAPPPAPRRADARASSRHRLGIDGSGPTPLTMIPSRLPTATTPNAVAQRETKADKFAAQHPEAEEDPNWALIGTDKSSYSPLAVELEKALGMGMALPAYLSRFLGGKEWTSGLNAQWMKRMIHQGRLFVVEHFEIKNALDEASGGKELQPDYATYLLDFAHEQYWEGQRKNEGDRVWDGTWAEVADLLDAGYSWFRGTMIPPNADQTIRDLTGAPEP